MSFTLKANTARPKQHFVAFLKSRRGFRWTRPYLAKTLLAQGKTPAALEQLESGDADAAKLDYLPVVLLANGRAPEAEAALQRLIAQNAATDAYYIAMTYAYRDEKQLALKWLERAYAQRDDGLLEMMGEPLLKNISAEPRFHAILHAMNLSDYVSGLDSTASTSRIASGSLDHSAN